MNKGLILGGGVGLLLVAAMGGYWLASIDRSAPAEPVASAARTTAPAVTTPQFAPPTPATADLAATTAPWLNNTPGDPTATPIPRVDLSGTNKAELQAQRAQLRERMKAIQTKGQNATLADARSLIDDIERMDPKVYDAQQVKALRQVLDYSERVQNLSKELSTLDNDKSGRANARRTEILAEMRELAVDITAQTKIIQSRTPSVEGLKR